MKRAYEVVWKDPTDYRFYSVTVEGESPMRAFKSALAKIKAKMAVDLTSNLRSLDKLPCEFQLSDGDTSFDV